MVFLVHVSFIHICVSSSEGRKQAYLFLRVRQAIPFLCDPCTNVLDGHVLEVTLTSAFKVEEDIGRGRTLNQSLIPKKGIPLVREPCQFVSCEIRFFDLKWRVGFDPLVVCRFIRVSVGLYNCVEALLYLVSNLYTAAIHWDTRRTSRSASLIVLVSSLAALNASCGDL